MNNILHRTFRAQPGPQQIDADARTIELAISSEEPYERWFGVEILSHKREAIDLSRLADNAHPLLLNHDTDEQIGVVSDPRIEDRRLRVTARFSRAQRAEEIRQDVADGIRQLVSVGYLVDEIVEIERPDQGDATDFSQWKPMRTFTGDEFRAHLRKAAFICDATCRPLTGAEFRAAVRSLEPAGSVRYQPGQDRGTRAGQEAARADSELTTFLVTKWTPFEASIVPIPADPTVGVGRAGVMPAQTLDDPQAVAGETRQPEPTQPAAAPVIITGIKTMTPEKTPAELEIERRDALMSIGAQYARYIGPNDLQQWVREGWSVDRVKDAIIEKIQSRHTDTSVGVSVGLSQKETRGYSLGRAIRAQLLGDWREAGLERECSEAVAKILGRSAEGFFVPAEAFKREFNVGTTTEAGNLVPTELRGDLFADVLRNKLVLGQLGCRVLGGLTSTLDIPRKTTGSTIGTLTETGSASSTNPLTAELTLSPKRVGAFVVTSKQSIIQSAIAIENMIRDDLVMGAAVVIENLAINGNGTGPQYVGIRNTTGIGTVVGGTNGLAPAWSHFVDLESACANANAEPDVRAGYLINTRTRGKLKQTQFATNLPFIWQPSDFPLNGYRAAVSNNVPANLTKGTSTTVCSSAIFGSDWSEEILGLFGAPDITVDPYTKADTGQVKITLNQYADAGVRRPGCFSKIDDLLAG
jgi:HK97 family phage major capsid protein